jgi:nicotinamidase-related amidase
MSELPGTIFDVDSRPGGRGAGTVPRKQALIVIDVQESFRHRRYWQGDELPAFLRNVQALVDHAVAKRIPIAQVFHQELSDDASDPFSKTSGFVRPMKELSLRADAVFHKHVHSAMFGRTADGVTLEGWLRHQGVSELLVTGIRTEQCCETTTRHASDLGFQVRYVTDATLTFPMLTRSGRKFSPAEIRERTELVLDGRFARIVSTTEAFT